VGGWAYQKQWAKLTTYEVRVSTFPTNKSQERDARTKEKTESNSFEKENNLLQTNVMFVNPTNSPRPPHNDA
jgi:hypothetical protein